MDTTTRRGTPLRQRMTEDMRTRKLEDKTQQAYIRAVRKLTVFLNRSPGTSTVEDLRNFQLQLVDSGTSPITLYATLSGLRFFFDITLGRVELMARMQPVKLPRTVPVVRSAQEATEPIAAARNVKRPPSAHAIAIDPAMDRHHGVPAVSSLEACPTPALSSVRLMASRRARAGVGQP